ncbi:MAG: hypothetical protein WCE99_02930, partial [Nitrososphaeraceae archaeon]
CEISPDINPCSYKNLEVKMRYKCITSYPQRLESSLIWVTIPLAAASTGVSSGTIKSIAYLSFPVCAGDEVLSMRPRFTFGTGNR